MPLALLAALAGSLAIHAAALFLPDVDLSTAPELAVITAELQPPPRPPASPEVRHAEAKPARHRPERHAEPRRPRPATAPAGEGAAIPAPVSQPESVPQAVAERQPEPEAAPEAGPLPASAPEPAAPRLPSRGYIRFAVNKGTEGLMVGRAEHSWEFLEDGRYRLAAVTETVGLAALFKSVRIELESHGLLLASGLQPERFTTRRNGSPTNENAEFDWGAHQVTLDRDGSRREMAEGAQDLLSFHYQFAYLASPAGGVNMGVATGKKFENYRFDAVGEENVETPAGLFRTLHVRVKTDSTTELWLALDRQMLPVKIRYTDRKGESFEQVATELGM